MDDHVKTPIPTQHLEVFVDAPVFGGYGQDGQFN